MAYPYSTLNVTKADATVTATDHPAHHNALGNALNDLLTELGTNPGGASADVGARCDAIESTNTTQTTNISARVQKALFPVLIGVALSDETTTITTGTAKATIHNPLGGVLIVTGVVAEVNTVSSSGLVTVDINEGAGAGTSILSTKLNIDASEETSLTAATPAVISDTSIASGGRLTFDIDAAGTGAKGLKVWIKGYCVVTDSGFA